MMSAKDHFCKTRTAVIRQSNHDSLMVNFEALTNPIWEPIEFMISMRHKTITSEIDKILCKAFDYFTEPTIEITMPLQSSYIKTS
jgi:hypothetical protein